MKTVVILLTLILLSGAIEINTNSLTPAYNGIAFNPNYGLVYFGSCGGVTDVTLEYRRALYEFTTVLYKRIAVLSQGHFVFSPLSIWMSLAALAEGTDGIAREELFKLLGLPQDKCIRQQYYAIASRRELSGNDVTFSRTRLFVFDEKVVLNKDWENFVCSHWLIGIIKGSLRSDPMRALQNLRNIFSAHIPYLDMSGNSVIMDALDYEALWTNAFKNARLERVPFYTDAGDVVGTVELMRMRKRVKLAYLPDLKLKVLELPVGHNGRYRLMFGLPIGNISLAGTIKILKSNIIFETLGNLRLSKIPLDVAIPRLSMSSEFDMKSILEDANVRAVWKDPWGTRNISDPAALPSGFVHRVTITLDKSGLHPYEEEISSRNQYDTGLHAEIGKDFIADRMFLFAAFDAETFSSLFCGIFTRPDEAV